MTNKHASKQHGRTGKGVERPRVKVSKKNNKAAARTRRSERKTPQDLLKAARS